MLSGDGSIKNPNARAHAYLSHDDGQGQHFSICDSVPDNMKTLFKAGNEGKVLGDLR